MRNDELVKSKNIKLSVIPAKAGIQFFKLAMHFWDPRFRGDDDFLRERQK
jgi:hypothetical protein